MADFLSAEAPRRLYCEDYTEPILQRKLQIHSHVWGKQTNGMNAHHWLTAPAGRQGMVACTYFGEITDVRKPNLNLVEAMTGSRDFSACPGG